MNTFAEFINRLRESGMAPDFLTRAGNVLSEDVDWGRLLATHLRQVDQNALGELVIRGFVTKVSPRPFLMWTDEEAAFQVVLNYFDASEAAKLLSEGSLKAHNHHRPFVSRVLRGSYLNFLYRNDGTRDKPRLVLAGHSKILPGSICEMPCDVFHSVISPEDGTLSIAVRGPHVFSKYHPIVPDYGLDAVTVDKSRILDALDSLGPSLGVGKRVRYAEIDNAS